MEQEQLALERLKECVLQKLSHSLESPSDFDYLVLKVSEETHEQISTTTLKRIFGYISSSSMPRRSSLAILARYIGYAGWEDFVNNVDNKDKSKSDNPSDNTTPNANNDITIPSDEPEQNQAKKHKWIKITLFIILQIFLIFIIWAIISHYCNTSYSANNDNGVALSELIANQYDDKTKSEYLHAMEKFLQQEKWLRQTINESRLQRDTFVQDFPASRLGNLTREEYDINNKNGFAYRVKYKMDWMGAFYDVDSKPYDCVDYTDKQFKQHLQNIVNLLNDGALGNKKAIKDNPLYKPLKYRLLSIYYPDSNYMPFWLDKEVKHFLDVLLPDENVRNILTPENCIDDREILYNYKNAHPIMKEWDNFMFMDFVFMYYPKWSEIYKKTIKTN